VFDLSASLGTRNRQLLECINVWRRAHRLAELPIPPAPPRVKPDQATIVTAVKWTKNGVQPSRDLNARIDAFKNKPLEVNKIVALLTGFAAKSEPKASGIEFKAIKGEDLTGVLLMVRLLPGAPPTESQGWSVNERVTLGRNNIHGSSGGGTLDAYSTISHWDDFAEAASKALAAEPKTPFEINVRLATGSSQ